MEYFYGHYVNSPADRSDARCCPALAKDLSGLPPALVQTAEFDPLRDEGVDYARALGEAGVAVVHTQYEGAIHGTISFAPMLRQGTDMRDEAAAWLRARLSP